jgi:p-aminobenzoyl-glutamate transporter AbgT
MTNCCHLIQKNYESQHGIDTLNRRRKAHDERTILRRIKQKGEKLGDNMKFLTILIIDDKYQFITTESDNVFFVQQEMKEYGEIKAILNEEQMKTIAAELIKNGTINW